jgi:hypothetical protein
MNPQMRMVVMLAVTWAAGSFLLAAESPSTRAPASANQKPPATQEPATQAPATTTPATPAAAAGKTAEEPKPDAEAKPAAETVPSEVPPPPIEQSKPPSGEVVDDAEKLPPPPNSGARGASPQRFVPSEQVRADFDVSFPIDI